jgi:hypothetical protein
MMALLIVLALIAVVALAAWASSSAPITDRDLSQSFTLQGYRVLGSDVGGHARRYLIEADGLRGAPDAVFASADELVVGDVKRRVYRGALTPYERYQMTLYLGMLQRRHPRRRVRGLLRYRNAVIDVPFDPDLYAWLLAQLPEYRRRTGGRSRVWQA